MILAMGLVCSTVLMLDLGNNWPDRLTVMAVGCGIIYGLAS